MNAEIDRLNSLPLRQLAVEVMVKGFGPDGPGGPGKPGTIEAPTMMPAPRASSATIGVSFIPEHRPRSIGMELQARLYQLIAEGLQVLEHASLVRTEWHANAGGLSYVATRLGRAALEQDAVGHILSGGSL